MLSAGEQMRQAGDTAASWLSEAAEFVERRFPDHPPTACARLIAAYVQAAAADEVAMYLRTLAEEAPEGVEAVRALTYELVRAARKLRDPRSAPPVEAPLRGSGGAAE